MEYFITIYCPYDHHYAVAGCGKTYVTGADKVLLMQLPLTYETSDVISTFVCRRGFQYAEYSFTTAVSVFNSVGIVRYIMNVIQINAPVQQYKILP